MIETFLTAYDPSDLPGASIDPLGFERGYLLLADKILPGLTNVASRPRYFAVLCAGVSLCGVAADGPPREVGRARQEMLLRFERYWALGNVLARPERSGGVRGVTYAQNHAAEVRRRGETRISAAYRLLSRQGQYGAIGIYANVADGMRFLNRDDFTLTPALGEVAAEAFLEETGLPASLRRAVVNDTDVGWSTLADWGERAHVDAPIRPREAACLGEALHAHDMRSRMAGLLRAHPFRAEADTELARLGRIERTLQRTGEHADLREALACIRAYESCYQLAQLALERLLWICRHHAGAAATLRELGGDAILRQVRERLPAQANRWLESLDQASTPGFRENLDRLADVRRFVEIAAGSAGDHGAFVDALVSRHTDIQHGKFDHGRRKMPWLERTGDQLALTMTRAGGRHGEATAPEDIAPHPYRTAAADALLAAAGEKGAA
ncbi:MAG: hypothetical protein RJA22_2867 [Verrucomicrobiota bacterium]